MPRVQVGSMVVPTEEILAHVWYREPAQRAFGTRFRLHWPKVNIVQADGLWSCSGVPDLDAAEWVFGKRSLPTIIRVRDWHADRLEFVPSGSHFRMLSLPGEAPSEVIGFGTVSGHKPFGVYAYPSDFRLEDVCFSRKDGRDLDRRHLRFQFERSAILFDGHWSEIMFTPPDEGMAQYRRYRHACFLDEWTEPAQPDAFWVCLHGAPYSFEGLVHPAPFTDGDTVRVLDHEGHLATGRVGRSSQGMVKPVLAEPYPLWTCDLDPSSGDGCSPSLPRNEGTSLS